MEPVKPKMLIWGEQIYLRPIGAEDTKRIVEWRNQQDVVKNFIYRDVLSVHEHEQWLKNKVFTGLVHQFIVCMREQDTPVGCVYLQKFEKQHRRAESGIFLGETAIRGKGIGTQAVRLLAEYGFYQLGLHKITARVLASNKASARLHEKAGYRQEAYLKDELFLDGKYEDLLIFGAIEPNANAVD